MESKKEEKLLGKKREKQESESDLDRKFSDLENKITYTIERAISQIQAPTNLERVRTNDIRQKIFGIETKLQQLSRIATRGELLAIPEYINLQKYFISEA